MQFKILTAIAISTFLTVITNVGLETHAGLFIKEVIASIPYCDKVVHFSMMITMSFLLYHAMNQRQVNILGHSLLFSSLLLAIGISLEELSQAFIPSRNFEIMDMVCNYAGIYLGSLLPRLSMKHLNDADQYRSEAISIQTIRHSTRPLYHESGHRRSALRRLVRRHGSR
ncbi:MAG: VanZ family protein [Saprospiraceae bacterium]|nr:VanZ family protein [Saprospiraceae bacterium]